jgi:hypothetical protein
MLAIVVAIMLMSIDAASKRHAAARLSFLGHSGPRSAMVSAQHASTSIRRVLSGAAAPRVGNGAVRGALAADRAVTDLVRLHLGMSDTVHPHAHHRATIDCSGDAPMDGGQGAEPKPHGRLTRHTHRLATGHRDGLLCSPY